MKDASKTLKADIKKIDINKVEDMTDDMADMMEDMNEINDIMGRSYKCVRYARVARVSVGAACVKAVVLPTTPCDAQTRSIVTMTHQARVKMA